jgi:hypothetical protein
MVQFWAAKFLLATGAGVVPPVTTLDDGEHPIDRTKWIYH